jgi:signal transduction histidine kinase
MEGEVEVTKVINADQERKLKVLKQGDFFGEMGLIHNAPRVATVTTTSPVKVLEIYKNAFDRMLKQSSSVSLAMVKEVSRRLRENDEMAIEDLRLKAGELASAYQRLAQEELARREFLSTIAHELRTPLTSASGYLDIVRQGSLDEDATQAALETVSRNINQIVSLVNDILFLQEVELVLPDLRTLDMGEIVTSAVDNVRRQAQKANISLHVDIGPQSPLVLGHARSLERAVEHLIDNAIKFSHNGGDVHIGVAKDVWGVKVSIQDHGIGISEELMPHIFDRFYHIDEAGGELYGGLGLGLAITKQVIEQHHGRIEVESEQGQGSVFSIYLLSARENSGQG